MASFVTQGIRALKGTVSLRGDKSIAHRAVMLASVAEGTTRLRNFPPHEDAAATLHAFRSLGVTITRRKDTVIIKGRGLSRLHAPRGPLFVNESGTTLRLLLGILAGQPFRVSLHAAASLSRRPMLRVIQPLRAMGVNLSGRRCGKEECAPITIEGGPVRALRYRMPVASAQVKSAVLFAGLYARGTTRVIEPAATRDHTERMLGLFGAGISRQGRTIDLRGPCRLTSPGTITIPGDISSAAFLIVAAILLPGSRIQIKTVSLNPSRIGILAVLARMGARAAITVRQKGGAEPWGDITVQAGALHGVTIQKKEIPSLIDELPALMVAACCASGISTLKGVEELRVKETDRIRSMTENLAKMGGRLAVVRRKRSEDIVIRGAGGLRGAAVSSFGDHRTAMAMIVAGMAASGRTSIDDIGCISKSFPDFLKVLKPLMVK
ncbi:MAG TPA: 3-phosphoshikimate 1-carboxyvinyltransferase [Candidatus Omnitrophota bacterium]|mgnify:CR=1 FL=1|nr:3-phosphoshikimate 1-carboxyvinyltransferase [Candidatus Omnitrophota bacterium]HQO38290.1 3-phosphoshikimate 1-carboxyvinyltransferase [Candidatus Omnitrophota bacterium]HQQ06196.1 3-phosphoshikimate 1-carboxyvinyltransferase [Candidatus Omnitrophota bacterium]